MAQMRMKQLITNDFKLSKVIDGVEMVYITGEFTKHYVTKHFGDVYCYFESTTDLKADFDFYNSVHGNDVIRLFDGLMEEYNPIENYDRNEVTTIGHTGTIGNTSNGTMTNKVSAYDSNTLVNDGESVTNGNTTTTLNNNDSTVSRIHGNIGVTTSSQMLQGEAQIRFNNYLEHYLNRWITTVIVAYGDELNEVEYAPDTEYATTDYVDNVADTLGERIDTLGDTVDTLNNSLGAVITDIDSNIKPTIEELINDDSDHEGRIAHIEGNLTASDDIEFKFSTDGINYGYEINGEFHPFSSGGGAPFEIVLDNVRTGQANNWQEYNTTSSPMPFTGVCRVYLSFWGYKGDYGIYKNGSRQSASFSQYHNTYQCCTQRYVLNVNEGDTLMFRAWGVGTNSAWWSVVAYLTEE